MHLYSTRHLFSFTAQSQELCFTKTAAYMLELVFSLSRNTPSVSGESLTSLQSHSILAKPLSLYECREIDRAKSSG